MSGSAPSVDLDRYRSVVPEWEAFLEASARPEPTVFRARTGRVDEEILLARLAAAGFSVRPVDGLSGFHQVVDGPHPLSATLEHWLGLLYVQQASTGAAAPALAPRPGERVLDLCAAPGGKTSHLAELMGDTGCIVANEINEGRIRGLLGNMYRLGHTNVLATAGDGVDFPTGALFDRVLVDAPCTGEGTLRRRGGRLRAPAPSFVRYVTRTQRLLLKRAVELVRPGGVVLYVTCTFAPEENEAVVSEALERLPIELEPLRPDFAHAPGLTHFEGQRFDARLEGAVRIYPHHLDSGGLFIARLRRTGGELEERSDAGWGAVPSLFPEEEAPDVDAEELVTEARRELAGRFGVESDALPAGWVVRGGRVWMHTLSEWPVEHWEADGWRAVSVGLRAVEFDSAGRPRPTNDLLRWLGDRVKERVEELDSGLLLRILAGEGVPTDPPTPGPVALRLGGDVVGRGAGTRRGLVSEIPKARAADLRRCLEARLGS